MKTPIQYSIRHIKYKQQELFASITILTTYQHTEIEYANRNVLSDIDQPQKAQYISVKKKLRSQV